MADKPAKRKAKPKQEPPSVLGTLPASRPERIGRPRRAAAEPVAKKPAKRQRAVKRAPSKPAAVSPASVPLSDAARATDSAPPKPLPAPTGTELVTTTIRAAGELAQIGFTVGGQML